MNTHKKIVVDHLLGAVIAFPLNYFVRLVGWILRPDHSLTQPKKRIVVCKFKGMGSIIQATPLLQTLREKYPEAEITFVSSTENQAILKRINLIDTVYLVNDKKISKLLVTSAQTLYKLIKNRADLYIDLEIYSNYASLMATFSMAHDRFGFYLKSSKYRTGLYTHLQHFDVNKPITEVYLQFANLLTCSNMIHSSYILPVDEQFQSPIPKETSYLVINPNASDLRIERRWPAFQFVQLLEQLEQYLPDHKLILIGSPAEAPYVADIAEKVKHPNLINLAGKTSLNGLIEIIRNADLVITNDTGPMHISSTLRKKTIALFGPCSPQQYAIGPHVFPIYKHVSCSPCVHEFIVPPCNGNNICMKQIEVDEVVQTAVKIIHSNVS